MHPVLFELHVGGATRTIAGYGVMLSLGLFVGGLVVALGARARRIDPFAVTSAIAIAVGAGLVTAYASFVAVEALRGASWLDAATHGGLTFYGGFFGGAVAFVIACRALGLPWLALTDIAAPGVAVGHAFGRVGCALAGCCYGAPYSGLLAVQATDPLAPAAHPPVFRHPVQLYEAVALAFLASVLLLVRRPLHGRGRRAACYVGAYAAIRLGTERFRGDSDRGLWFGASTSTSELVALGCLVLATAFLAWPAMRVDRTQAG